VCEVLILSVLLKKVYVLKVFKNRVLTKIFRPKREQVTAGWRSFKMRGHEFYSSLNTEVIKYER
jgi:hypothetical protein